MKYFETNQLMNKSSTKATVGFLCDFQELRQLLTILQISMEESPMTIARRRIGSELDRLFKDLDSGHCEGIAAYLRIKWFYKELEFQLTNSYLSLTKQEEERVREIGSLLQPVEETIFLPIQTQLFSYFQEIS